MKWFVSWLPLWERNVVFALVVAEKGPRLTWVCKHHLQVKTKARTYGSVALDIHWFLHQCPFLRQLGRFRHTLWHLKKIKLNINNMINQRTKTCAAVESMYQFHIQLDAGCLRKALGLHCHIFAIAMIAKLGYLGDGWHHALAIIQNLEPTIISKVPSGSWLALYALAYNFPVWSSSKIGHVKSKSWAHHQTKHWLPQGCWAWPHKRVDMVDIILINRCTTKWYSPPWAHDYTQKSEATRNLSPSNFKPVYTEKDITSWTMWQATVAWHSKTNHESAQCFKELFHNELADTTSLVHWQLAMLALAENIYRP